MSYAPLDSSAVPSYLQGTQTGSLLQNISADPNANQSYVPAISGTQQQQYTPGYGQAPYSNGPPDFGSMSQLDIQNYLLAQRQQLAANGGEFSTPNSISSASTPSTPNSGGPTIAGYPTPTNYPLQDTPAGLSGGALGGKSTGNSNNSNGSSTTNNPNTGILQGLNNSGVAPNSSPQVQQLGFPSPGSVNYAAPGASQANPMVNAQMQQANPQNAMNQFQNSLGYQVLGSNQADQYQQSPGYQFAVTDALRQLNQNASSRGLLDSGSALRGATNQVVGMANQDYNNWWNQQNQIYNNYQNSLAGLAGGATGAQNAMATGQNAASGTMQTANDLGSLFGNLGTSGMSGIINTGAAQAGNMMGAGTQQAQITGNNQATQLAGATSLGNTSGFQNTAGVKQGLF